MCACFYAHMYVCMYGICHACNLERMNVMNVFAVHDVVPFAEPNRGSAIELAASTGNPLACFIHSVVWMRYMHLHFYVCKHACMRVSVKACMYVCLYV